MTKIRKPELEQYKQVWVTAEAYKKLRAAKRKLKKSMARIVNDLIFSEFGNTSVKKVRNNTFNK